MKKTRMIVAALMAMVMLLLVACGGNGGNNTKNETPDNKVENTTPDNTPDETPDTPDETPAGPAPEFDGKLKGPYQMTTCGQSTGSVMLNMVAMSAGLTSLDDHALSADTFSRGDANTLIVTTGTSGKGMGAAGTDVNDEIERCTALIEEAKAAGMTIVCAHVEGMSRRTDANDQASIEAIMPLADVIMVVTDSDSDGLFSDYAAENNIPIISAKDTLSLGEYME